MTPAKQKQYKYQGWNHFFICYSINHFKIAYITSRITKTQSKIFSVVFTVSIYLHSILIYYFNHSDKIRIYMKYVLNTTI